MEFTSDNLYFSQKKEQKKQNSRKFEQYGFNSLTFQQSHPNWMCCDHHVGIYEHFYDGEVFMCEYCNKQYFHKKLY